MWNPLSLIPTQYQLAAKIVMLLVTLAVVFSAGWTVRGWKAADDENEILSQQMEAMQAYERISREFVIAFNEKRTTVRTVYRTITKEVENVTTGRLCFDPSAVRLWNRALDGVSADPSGVTETSSGADTSGASDKEVLGNAIANFEQYEDCRAQLNAIIDWSEGKRQ